MEPEGSLPRSQELSTCTYSDPNQSSPKQPNPISKRSMLIFSMYLRQAELLTVTVVIREVWFEYFHRSLEACS
jgi:hypothetical protein